MAYYDSLQFEPPEGYGDKSAFETRPSSETRAREIFNALPEQIKAYLNRLTELLNLEYELLRSQQGGETLGLKPLASGYETKLQPALARLKNEINTAVLGQLPNSSVTLEKLAEEVASKVSATAGVSDEVAQYTLFPQTMTAGERAAFEADSEKMALYRASTPYNLGFLTGVYTGDNQRDREILTGFRPTAVLVFHNGCQTYDFDTGEQRDLIFGGLGLFGESQNVGIDITSRGFRVHWYVPAINLAPVPQTNIQNFRYSFIAWR